jgi:DNA-binding MarR family transcriptional regulator
MHIYQCRLTVVADRLGAELLRASGDLRVALGRVVRRLRQGHVVGEATLAEASVLSRLDRDGPATPGCLAELDRVRPQAMGVTLAALAERGLVARDPDPADGRRVLMSITPAGRRLMTDRRSRSSLAIAQALADGFTPAERRRLVAAIPLLERLADRL